MTTVEIQRVLINNLEECAEVNLDSVNDKKKFLANLAGVPYTSIYGDDRRLLTEIFNWMNIES